MSVRWPHGLRDAQVAKAMASGSSFACCDLNQIAGTLLIEPRLIETQVHIEQTELDTDDFDARGFSSVFRGYDPEVATFKCRLYYLYPIVRCADLSRFWVTVFIPQFVSSEGRGRPLTRRLGC